MKTAGEMTDKELDRAIGSRVWRGAGGNGGAAPPPPASQPPPADPHGITAAQATIDLGVQELRAAEAREKAAREEVELAKLRAAATPPPEPKKVSEMTDAEFEEAVRGLARRK